MNTVLYLFFFFFMILVIPISDFEDSFVFMLYLLVDIILEVILIEDNVKKLRCICPCPKSELCFM